MKSKNKRRLLVYSLKSKGKTHNEIASVIKVSPSRAQKIFGDACRIVNNKGHWTNGLSSASQKKLFEAGIFDREKVKHAVKIGIISSLINDKDCCVEITDWVDLFTFNDEN